MYLMQEYPSTMNWMSVFAFQAWRTSVLYWLIQHSCGERLRKIVGFFAKAPRACSKSACVIPLGHLLKLKGHPLLRVDSLGALQVLTLLLPYSHGNI